MIILSLFDGISCGRVALDRLGVDIDKYYASEIDPNAIQISNKNYPDIIRLGDVINWHEWNIEWDKIDVVMGGFPCQAFSMAGKEGGIEDERGKLFFVLIDIITHVLKHNPNAKWLMENVKMKVAFETYITKFTEDKLGLVEKICIDSALLSAQRRKRWYWSNFNISIPKDKNIMLSDITDEPLNIGKVVGRKIVDGKRADNDKSVKLKQYLEVTTSQEKSNTLTTFMKDCVLTNAPIGRHLSDSCKANMLNKVAGGYNFRFLHIGEAELLQTLPIGYTDAGLNVNKRYKSIGNGWTVDVICHIFKQMLNI